MNRLRERMAIFMQGRYGMDQFGKVLTYGTLIIFVLSMMLRIKFLNIVGVIGLIYSYYRMFSRDIEKRYQENQKFLKWSYKFIAKKSKIKNNINNKRKYRIFNCPNCKQKIRVPKGKGKICIKCPKCRIEFNKKT